MKFRCRRTLSGHWCYKCEVLAWSVVVVVSYLWSGVSKSYAGWSVTGIVSSAFVDVFVWFSFLSNRRLRFVPELACRMDLLV